MFSRSSINEHFLIKRPFDDKNRISLCNEIEFFFNSLSNKKFYIESTQLTLRNALVYLRSDPNAIQSGTKKRDLLKLCEERPNLFLNLDIYNLLIDGVRREYTSSFKTKANPSFCHLCAEILSNIFKDIEKLPVEILQVICDDWGYDCVWINCASEVQLFCNSVLRVFLLFMPSPQTSHGFSNEKALEIKYYIIGTVQSFGEIANFKTMKTAQRSSLLKFLALGCKYLEIKRSCFVFLPEWCLNTHFRSEVELLFLNFCCNLDLSNDYDLDVCKDIICCKRIEEPIDLVSEGIWFIFQNGKDRLDDLINIMLSSSLSHVQDLYCKLMDRFMKEFVGFSKSFFVFLQRNNFNSDGILFVVDCNKHSPSVSQLIEHICLNYDKLSYQLDVGIGNYSLLIESLINSNNPNFSMISNLVHVFINGYLLFHCKHLVKISEEMFEKIIGLFKRFPFLPISNSTVFLSLRKDFNFTCSQFSQLTKVMLENTVRCMIKYNFTPQKDSFDSAFVSWLMKEVFCRMESDPIVNSILLCVTSIAPEIVGFHVWNEFPQMQSVICKAICEGSVADCESQGDSNDSSNNYSGSQSIFIFLCKLLCRCRSPDFLMEFISNSKITSEYFDILTGLLRSNEHILDLIPPSNTVDLLIYLDNNTNKKEDFHANVHGKLLRRMEIYLESSLSTIVDWIISHKEPYNRIKGYRLVHLLSSSCKEFDYFETLDFLETKVSFDFDRLIKWNLVNEFEKNILSATLQTFKGENIFPSDLELDQNRIEDINTVANQLNISISGFKIPLNNNQMQVEKSERTYSESTDNEPIDSFFFTSGSFTFATSPLQSNSSKNEDLLETGEIDFKPISKSISKSPLSSVSFESFPDIIYRCFSTEPFNLSLHYHLLRISHRSPQYLDEYFEVLLENISKKPSRTFRIIDIFSTCIGKMASIPCEKIQKLVEFGFEKGNTIQSVESVLRLCHNFCKVSYESGIEMLKRIHQTHLIPRASFLPNIINPMIQSLQSQKPMIIYQEGYFKEDQKKAIQRTFQSLVDCRYYSSSTFSGASRCLDELASISSGYPEILMEVCLQLSPLLFLDCTSSDNTQKDADCDKQMESALQTIRAKGYDLILRLLTANPNNLPISISFVDSLNTVAHDKGFVDMMVILCSDFCSDIRLRQLYQSISKHKANGIID